MYKIRVTTTVEQVDFDGRVLFSATDTVTLSSIIQERSEVNVPRAFSVGGQKLISRLRAVLDERYKKEGQ